MTFLLGCLYVSVNKTFCEKSNSPGFSLENNSKKCKKKKRAITAIIILFTVASICTLNNQLVNLEKSFVQILLNIQDICSGNDVEIKTGR